MNDCRCYHSIISLTGTGTFPTWHAAKSLERKTGRVWSIDIHRGSGVYLWRWDTPIPRFAGSCDLVYVGESANVRTRLHRHLKFCNYGPWSAQFWGEAIRNEKVSICWFSTDSKSIARDLERRLLRLYKDVHHEFPPGQGR